jgi:hypothetical protein
VSPSTYGPGHATPAHERLCECGKRCYPSRSQARQAHRTAAFRVRVYRCGLSGAFHVASGEKRSR